MGSFLQVVVQDTDMKIVALIVILARLSYARQVRHKLQKLGDLVELKSAMHPLNGSVYYRVSDPGTIVVVGLHYTQPGPDVFFWAGETRGNGGCNDDNIAQDSYSLAAGVTVRSLKWICIWCREFSENFCQINIENGIG